MYEKFLNDVKAVLKTVWDGVKTGSKKAFDFTKPVLIPLFKVLFVLSMTTFTLGMMLPTKGIKSENLILTDVQMLYISLAVSFLTAIAIVIFTKFPISSVKISSFGSLVLSAIVTRSTYKYLKATFWNQPVAKHFAEKFEFFKHGTFTGKLFYILFLFFVFLVLNWAFAHIIKFLKELYETASKTERYMFYIGSVVLIALISWTYSQTTGFHSSMDRVYSIDSSYNVKSIFPKLFYADIRHVGFSIVTFPIYSICQFITDLLGVKALLPILLGIVNVEMLLIIGLLLRRIADNNNFVFALYFASSPVWIFALFIEKYTLAVLFAVLFVYAIKESQRGNKVSSCVLSAAAISTSSVLIPFAALGEKKIKNMVLRVVQVSLFLVLLFTVTGRLTYMVHVKDLTEAMKFFTKDLTYKNKFYLTIETIKSLIFVMPFVKKGNTFWWYADMGKKLDYVGLAILIICVIGYLFKIRKKEYSVFLYWIAFVFFLYVKIGFSVYNGPLFGLYFSWAFIPLFVSGVQGIFKRIPKIGKAVLISVIVIAVAQNIYHLGVLLNFLKDAFPVKL